MSAGTADIDAADMQALQSGENPALDRLMTRWQVPLRAFLYRSTQNESDAMDLAQETFVRVYRHRARYRPGSRFSTWLFAIAYNLARDRARRLAVRPTTALDDAPEPVDPRNPRSRSEADERVAAVRDAIAKLPTDLRTAVILSEYDDCSYAEIAAITGATVKAVETRLYRARMHLRKRLSSWLKDTPLGQFAPAAESAEILPRADKATV